MVAHQDKQNDYENNKLLLKTKFQQKKLLLALSLIVPIMAESANFQVSVANDDGTGLTPDTLSWAILQTNQNPGPDKIILTTDTTITGVMTRLIDSDVTLQSDQTRRTINGNHLFRPLFIISGNVNINNLEIDSGLAKGGDPGGAGLGGAIFIYSGQVNISHVTIAASMAKGGEFNHDYADGGGGMLGDGSRSELNAGGGGLFASGTGSQGGYGGWGNYQNGDDFGRGGDLYDAGGFGGGGGSAGWYGASNGGGNGGFGGAGGGCYCGYTFQFGGDGGFGASGGYSYSVYGINGYGATLESGAGFGGAIFIRSGSLSLSNVNITRNSASATDGAKGLGGGLFVLHTLNNSNGNNQGMPKTLATVTACEVSFSFNAASSDPSTVNNNDHFFDLAGIINADTGDPASVMCSDVIFAGGFD